MKLYTVALYVFILHYYAGGRLTNLHASLPTYLPTYIQLVTTDPGVETVDRPGILGTEEALERVLNALKTTTQDKKRAATAGDGEGGGGGALLAEKKMKA